MVEADDDRARGSDAQCERCQRYRHPTAAAGRRRGYCRRSGEIRYDDGGARRSQDLVYGRGRARVSALQCREFAVRRRRQNGDIECGSGRLRRSLGERSRDRDAGGVRLGRDR